jgi:hypothetical protein
VVRVYCVRRGSIRTPSDFELLEHISQHGPVVDTPILTTSDADADADKSKAENYSVTGYLV